MTLRFDSRTSYLMIPFCVKLFFFCSSMKRQIHVNGKHARNVGNDYYRETRNLRFLNYPGREIQELLLSSTNRVASR
jgi:hypothetical protein